jgi:hypothetical protein
MSTENDRENKTLIDTLNEENQLIDMNEEISGPQEGSRLDATFPKEE